ncbi:MULTISPECIES: hypothetical protein [unclassified Microcoleus]|uniref:hypothetical protein n=1 Tax=unclassified Microcoleus TaxID=2642155 RepID=UPI0025F7E261|nr:MULTISPECIES: hypothetical protein [unclassified Microcoleus]
MAVRQQAIYGILTDVADLSDRSRSENQKSTIKIFPISRDPPLPLLPNGAELLVDL